MPASGFAAPADASREAPVHRPLWLRLGQGIGITLAFASLLLIYLPDLPVVGRLFYPFGYRTEIEQQARAFGLDPLFVAAVIRQESGFRPQARSAAGAMGLMQLMPATARWAAPQMGLRGFRDEQLLDPALNVRVGCWYLNYLFQRFRDPAKVLAAYNGGEGNMKFWSTLRGEPLAWAYPETQTYVSQCLRAYRRYHELYDVERPSPTGANRP
ncbi:MAG: lytic transglycosylase domain-containing protein [Candidatus Sericytochromatia bacterium]|nr:lytic transglycosylase domain-containing protein [Candidatus Sericytochromatia bacterium]